MMRGILIYLFMSAILSARTLNIEKAIELALLNEKSIKTYEISKMNAQLDIKTAFKTALPNVVYSGQYQRSEYPRKVESYENAKSGHKQSITIYQPIFQGGSIIGGILGSKAYGNIADLNYLGEKRDVRLQLIKTYCDILISEKNKMVYESTKKQLEENYNKQRAQLEMRLIIKADILKTEYSLSDIETQIVRIENQMRVQKLNFKILTGIPEGEEIELKEVNIPENVVGEINFPRDLDQALSNSLSARIAFNNVKWTQAKQAVARAALLPEVKAFAQLGGVEKRQFSDTIDDAKWLGGVTVSWNAFSFGKDMDTYTVAKNNTKIENIKESITKDNIEVNVTDAYLELIRLEKNRISRYRGYQAAKENLDIDIERYGAGLISTVDYLLSVSQFNQASVDYNIVELDYYVAFEKYRSLLI